jgi:hypothetical protein
MSELVLIPTGPYVPILAAYKDGPNSVVAWCGLCKRWHNHGFPAGYTASHCDHERRGHFSFPRPVPRWDAYWLTFEHPYADIEQPSKRPKLEPLGWRIPHVARRQT